MTPEGKSVPASTPLAPFQRDDPDERDDGLVAPSILHAGRTPLSYARWIGLLVGLATLSVLAAATLLTRFVPQIRVGGLVAAAFVAALWLVRYRRGRGGFAADLFTGLGLASAGLGRAGIGALLPAITAAVVLSGLYATSRARALAAGIIGAAVPLAVNGALSEELPQGQLGRTVLVAVALAPIASVAVHELALRMLSVQRAYGLERELSRVGARLVTVDNASAAIEAAVAGALAMLDRSVRGGGTAAVLDDDGDRVLHAGGDEARALEGQRFDAERLPSQVTETADSGRSTYRTGTSAGSSAGELGLAERARAVLVAPMDKEERRHGLLVAAADQPLPAEARHALDALGHMTGIALAELAYSQDLHLSRSRFRSLVLDSSDVVAVLDADGRLRYASPSTRGVLGQEPEQLFGAALADVTHPEDRLRVQDFLALAANQSEPGVGVRCRLRHLDGSWRHCELRGRRLTHDCGPLCPYHDGEAPDEVIVNLRDVSDRVALEGELTHRAFHDGLTDLANRALFVDRTEHGLAVATRSGGRVGLVFLDLDDFKSVNDSLGHHLGDELLVQVAGRLRECVRPSDTAARLGGDEFGMLLEDVSGPEEACAVAARVLACLEPPFSFGIGDVRVRASAGVVLSEGGMGGTELAGDLLRKADVAMYQAKRGGGGRLSLYRAEEHTASLRRLQRLTELQGAVERGEFVAHYQPTMDLDRGVVCGVEALVRWRHPDGVLVPPAEFIPLAEESGLIVAIGAWVLREACTQVQAWDVRFAADDPLELAVNLSVTQLQRPELVAEVAQTLAETGFPPERLTLEITESVLMADITLATTRLAELKTLGVRLAVDDFGTGYSSLAYLQRFPVDTLKIDRTFVDGVDGSAESAALAGAIVRLARTLSLRTIAEGIERHTQVQALQRLRCPQGQGYYYARPLRADAVERLLDTAPATGLGLPVPT